MRGPALERTHAFMGSLIHDLAINILSGLLVSLTGLALRRLRQRHIRRRNELPSTTETGTGE